MKYECPKPSDEQEIRKFDKFVPADLLKEKIDKEEVLICRHEGMIIATLRYSLFWDQYPFLNLIKVHQEYRRKGIGTELVKIWEAEVSSFGNRFLMISTQSDESSHHFFEKLGYNIRGSFTFPNQANELILIKDLDAMRAAEGDKAN